MQGQTIRLGMIVMKAVIIRDVNRNSSWKYSSCTE